MQANALKMMEKMKGTSDVMKVLLDHCCSILLDAESVQILVETICGMLHDLNDCTHDEDKTILQRVQLLKVNFLYLQLSSLVKIYRTCGVTCRDCVIV